jgi:hypothetical protein
MLKKKLAEGMVPKTRYSFLKGIVQRGLTGVETGLRQSVLLSYSVGKFSFWIFKGTPS